VFERDGLLDSLNKEGRCNVWELVGERERAEGCNERTRVVLWPARYAEFTVRKGCLVSCVHPQANRCIYNTKIGKILVFPFFTHVCVCLCVCVSGRVESFHWIIPSGLTPYLN
jgi:hypothetical protein